MNRRSLPPDVAASWRNLLKSLEVATNLIESFAGVTEQLAPAAENEADVRELAAAGLLLVEQIRHLIQLTRETVGD